MSENVHGGIWTPEMLRVIEIERQAVIADLKRDFQRQVYGK